MWVFTKSYNNDNSQFGDYLITVFQKKPTAKQLRKVAKISDAQAKIVLEKGEADVEDNSYMLSVLACGERYKDSMNCYTYM